MQTDPKTNMADDEPLDPLTETALEWLVHLHSGEETEQDWQRYEHWKTSNAAQMAASQAAEALWENIGPAVKRPTIKKAITQLLVILVLFGGVLSAGVQQQFIDSPVSWLADYRTSTEPSERITLADGSYLQMDASTQVDIDFSRRLRRVIVYNGQIHIDVASDKNRPLEVVAADLTVRALGTGFNVKRYGEHVTVAVTEHSVQVTQADHSELNYTQPNKATSITLNEGQTLQYNDTTGFKSPAPADLAALMAWQRGRLIFDNKPLGDVVQDMQRYSDSKIVFLSDALKQQRVTGVFDIDDTDGDRTYLTGDRAQAAVVDCFGARVIGVAA